MEMKMNEMHYTYSLGFFFGPGLPLILAIGSDPFAAAALLFTPFFFGPSVGGPMGACDGVPAAAGVPGVDSETLSPFDAAGACSLGTGVGAGGDSFTGDSSLMDDGSMIFRSLMEGTRSVTNAAGGLPEDFRRSFSLEEEDALLGVGMMMTIIDVFFRRKLRWMM